MLKNQEAKSLRKTMENLIFFAWFQQLEMNNKNWGWRSRLLYFIAKLYKCLENKNINYRQLCLCCAGTLNKIKKKAWYACKKEKGMIWMYDQQVFARKISTKRLQLVWTWKGVSNNRHCLGNWTKYKILHIYFSRLLLIF